MTDYLRKAAEMALEALEFHVLGFNQVRKMELAIEALEQALAQPEQEPVAWLDSDGFPWSKEGVECRSVKDTYKPLYAGSPPIKEQQPVAWRYKIVTNCWTYSEEYPNKELAGDAWERWNVTPLYTAPPSKPWVSLSDRDITGAAHTEARYPVSILETTDSGLCMQFSETGEWHASDKRGDFMKVNGFLMSFARAIEAALRSKNDCVG